MAQDKNYNSVPYKRIIDLAKLDTAGVSDLLRVWNVASGSEKVISLENIVAGNITPVTIGTPTNGLAIDSAQVLTIRLASTSTTGALSSTDWNTFNNKPSSYITLNDTTDLDYVGKNGFVPVVVGESILSLQPLPQIAENGLISGGIVQWTGSGYVFNVSSAFYRIGGNPYESDPTQVTLSAPDATNNRIDVFAVDVNGLVVVIEGAPSATPVKPQINPQTQLELTSVIVTAASTAPTLTEEIIYDQNVEWTGSSAGTGTANFASTVAPYQGTVSVETTNIQDAFYIQFDNGVPIDISGYQTLGFQLKLKASMPANQNITGVFLDNSGNPASSSFNLSFDKSSTAYQFVGLVLSSLIFSGLDARYLRFTFNRSGGAPTYSGYFLDILKLEGGINPPQTVGSFTGLNDTPNSYSGQAGKSVAVKSDESGLEFVVGGGGASTFLDLTDTPSTYVSQSNKFPRVNAGETALAFDTVSPYDLDQETATDGQVLTWVNANSRYEPVSSGGAASQDNNFRVIEIRSYLLPADYTKTDVLNYLNTTTIVKTDIETLAVDVITGIPLTGLISYYKLDETSGTVTNDSFSVNNGTILNGATLGVVGKVETAYQLDGIDDYVDFGNPTVFQITTGSVSCWIKTSGAGSSFRGVVVKQFAFGIFLLDNVLGSYSYGSPVGFKSTGINVADGVWHHVVLVFENGTNTNKIYLDGVLALTFSANSTSQTVSLQAGAYGGTQRFNGIIDEVAIYSIKITQDDVNYLYNSGNGSSI